MSELFNKIKELREVTGAGFVDCKKALLESEENIEKAVEILRKKGISKALNKAKRSANEGVVSMNITDKVGILIEINTETDFVAKNVEFLSFVKSDKSTFRNL